MTTPEPNEMTLTPGGNTTPGMKRKTPSFRSSSKKLRQPFKSPFHSNQRSSSEESEESLKQRLKSLDEEIEMLQQEYSEEELQLHIEKLHEYNEIKDAGQLLLGKLGELEGKTTRSLYQEFGLDLDD